MSEVRVRFAPSPTGGLHIGGVRTALFAYLCAKHFNGKFILRIEDTDQNRFVEGAEQYIVDTLEWCGLVPDESPQNGGEYGPYRQSERKEIYAQYANQLINQGFAYYAFDTKEELETARNSKLNWQYNSSSRLSMNNSLTRKEEEVTALLEAGVPYVIRIKMPENETIEFTDLVRDHVSVQSNLVDDKVLIKADGMPTYHLAVVVDDYLMKISHVFRGEEWLPSAPVHIKLWEYLGWKSSMPQFAHLPLILKPNGKGKLSKRDGEQAGFPVFAMNWKDPRSDEFTEGFKEKGFLPEAFLNLLLMMGWHGKSDQEIYSLQGMKEAFDINRIIKAGAKFDYQKALWFNQQHIKSMDSSDWNILSNKVLENYKSNPRLNDISASIQDRCVLLSDIKTESSYFLNQPECFDIEDLQNKWNEQKELFFENFLIIINTIGDTEAEWESAFKGLMQAENLKPGDVMLPYRLMLTGYSKGPSVFLISSIIGKAEVKTRIQTILNKLK